MLRYRWWWFFCLTTSCVVTKTISVALLLYPGLGLALSESKQWRSYDIDSKQMRRYYRFNAFAEFIATEGSFLRCLSRTLIIIIPKRHFVSAKGR